MKSKKTTQTIADSKLRGSKINKGTFSPLNPVKGKIILDYNYLKDLVLKKSTDLADGSCVVAILDSKECQVGITSLSLCPKIYSMGDLETYLTLKRKNYVRELVYTPSRTLVGLKEELGLPNGTLPESLQSIHYLSKMLEDMVPTGPLEPIIERLLKRQLLSCTHQALTKPQKPLEYDYEWIAKSVAGKSRKGPREIKVQDISKAKNWFYLRGLEEVIKFKDEFPDLSEHYQIFFDLFVQNAEPDLWDTMKIPLPPLHITLKQLRSCVYGYHLSDDEKKSLENFQFFIPYGFRRGNPKTMSFERIYRQRALITDFYCSYPKAFHSYSLVEILQCLASNGYRRLEDLDDVGPNDCYPASAELKASVNEIVLDHQFQLLSAVIVPAPKSVMERPVYPIVADPKKCCRNIDNKQRKLLYDWLSHIECPTLQRAVVRESETFIQLRLMKKCLRDRPVDPLLPTRNPNVAV